MKKIILVVDNDKSNLMIAQKVLNDKYRVAAVNSGKMVFEYLKKNIPDLILLDINLADISGFEIMERIRNTAQWCKIPVIFLSADRNINTEEKCFESGAVDYIGKPFVPTVLEKRVSRTLEMEAYRQSLEKMVAMQLEQITRMQNDVIMTLGNVIESRDGTTGQHIKRTSVYVSLLAESLKKKGAYTETLTEDYMSDLRRAAPLHDIGKITIPDSILSKPGRLTPEEYEIVKLHTRSGERLIRENMSNMVSPEFLKMACDVACLHHEKWNGLGYPRGLKGEDIPLSARILAVADVFDALVSKRPYKDVMSIDTAFEIMQEDKGKAFEPIILETFFELRPTLEKMVKYD